MLTKVKSCAILGLEGALVEGITVMPVAGM